MGLFTRKRKVSTEEFCREFYDNDVFGAVGAGADMLKIFLDTAFDLIVQADGSFATIDRGKFQDETTAIRMELFALAWMHRFKQVDLAVPQSVFTRRYLRDTGRSQVWDIMGDYNQVIAYSATADETGQQVDGRLGRALAAGTNRMRFDIFDKWFERMAIDPDNPTAEQSEFMNCLASVLNRIGADVRRRNCILVKLMAARLAKRLDCGTDLNSEALFRLSAVAHGFYQGAKEAIKNIELPRS